MPKPKHILSSFYKTKLYWKLVDTVCFPILTKSDCKKISDLIAVKNLPRVSESTLYRLLLLKNNDQTPYFHTLDILALFCGFANWFELEEHFNEASKFEYSFGKINESKDNKNSLLKICIHKNELKSLYEFTEQFDSSLLFEKKLILGAEFYHSLKSNKNKNEIFYKKFSQLPIVRESFYELFADPNFEIKDYELGLRYYLIGIKPGKSINALQDFIFGNSLLFRYYYLSNNKTESKKIAKLLYEENNFSESDLNKIYIFPHSRYLAYKLFYFYSNDQILKARKHENWLINYAKNKMNKYDLLKKRILFYTIADAFCNNGFTSIKKQEELKNIFKDIFDLLPEHVFNYPLKSILPYLDQNASVRWAI